MADLSRVILWTAPRSISTAFERSVRELKNGQIFHEPFSQACYLGPDRPWATRDYDPDMEKTFENAWNKLTADYPGKSFVFAKDMAYCATDHFEELTSDENSDLKHTFLIRDPAKAIPSMYKASLVADNWGSFNQNEVGFKELYDLYRLVKEIDDDVIIVDADDLLAKPDEMMKSYCETTGLPYDARMTSWEPGPVADWAIWGAGWMEEVERTSGFIKRDPSKRKTPKDVGNLPDFVKKLIKDLTPEYQEMFEARLKV